MSPAITITFGQHPDDVNILYDRDNKICVVVANSAKPFPDAVATARALKADRIFVVASEETVAEFGSMIIPKDVRLYEFDR